jgi:L-rhamnose isomerase
MFNRIRSINRYYDRIPEPWRFFIALALLSPVFCTSVLPLWGVIAAIAWICLIMLVRICP